MPDPEPAAAPAAAAVTIQDFNAQFQVLVTRHEQYPAVRPRAHVVGFTVRRFSAPADQMYIDVQVPFGDLPPGHLPEEVVHDAWARVGASVREWATRVLARDSDPDGYARLVGEQLLPTTLV